jgi:hypothetical protein
MQGFNQVTREQQIALMEELSKFFGVTGTYSNLRTGTGTVFSSHLQTFAGNDISRLDLLAGIRAGAASWQEIEQTDDVRGVMGVSIWFGAGLDHPENRARWKNGLPFWPVITTGEHGGKEWKAGQAGAVFCIAYPGDLGELWEIPGGIIGIIQQVQTKAGKTKAGKIYANYQPLKSLAMIASADKESRIEPYLSGKRNQLKTEDNPFLLTSWEKSSAAVVFAGRETENRQKISQPDDLRRFISVAFGEKSFTVLLNLCLIQAQAKKDTFEVSIPELCKAIWGAKYHSGEPQKVWETLEALNQTEIKLSQPGKGKTTEIYRFRPVTIRRETIPDGQTYPKRARITLFDAGEDTTFRKLLIPGKIEQLKSKDMALLIYLLVRENQFPEQSERILLDEVATMSAAGIMGTYNRNKSKARADLRARLVRIAAAGCIGELLEIENGKIYLKYQGQKSAQPPQLPHNQRKRKR